MKIVEANVEFMSPIVGEEILRHIEQCGRVCYKSESRITQNSAKEFIQNIIKRGHEAVLEHAGFTVKFICDRGVSHELVRHRLASYCQESTRYCNYSSEKFGNEITVIKPCFFDNINHDRVINALEDTNSLIPLSSEELAYSAWYSSCHLAERNYFILLNLSRTPQEARAVLPNSLKTEVVMTANIREWRYFLRLRCSKAAHPQMREVAIKLLKMCQEKIPILFDDIDPALL